MSGSRLPEIIAGRYRPIGQLGKGGMGSVILVEHVNTGDKLALKMLHTAYAHRLDLVERFKREARAAAKIKSDHVVRIIDADVAIELDGLPFMVMEVLNGEDVKQRLARLGRLPNDQVVHLLSQVARALDRAHAMGIIHRDIKPENIFLHVGDNGVEIVKLLDFGISKILDEAEEHATQTGQMLGTPAFMAPEQVKTQPPLPQTDMWAVGMVAYRMLSGKNYWPKVSAGEQMVAVLTAPMRAPSSQIESAHLGGAFDAWFLKSCDRDPTRRWASVTEQVNALGAALRLAAPAGSLPAFAPSPPSSTEVLMQIDVERTSSEASLAAQSSAVTNRTHTVQARPTRPFAIIGALAALFVVVTYGSLRIMQSRDPRPAIPISGSIGTPLPSAPAPSAVATDPSATASQNPVISSAVPIESEAPHVVSHAHPPASTTKKTTTPAPAKSEDPWAR